MPISNSDLLKLRNSEVHTLDPKLVVVPTEIVATATVLNTPNIYPVASLAVTGTSSGWNDVKIGHFFKIEDGSNIVTWGVVRLTPTSNTLYIDAKSQGDSGIGEALRLSITSGNTITIYNIRPMWTLFSKITNGVFFKKFDVAYDGSGSNPNPVVNIGEHQIIKANRTSGLGTVVMSATNSFAWGAKTISSYSWSLPIYADIISGGTNQSSVTFTLPEGYHEVYCTITDSGSKTMTVMRCIWIIGNDEPALSDRYALEITGDSQDNKGREITFTLTGEDFDNDVIMPAAMVVFQDFPLYDGGELDTSYLVDNFAGFITDRSEEYTNNGQKSVSFTAKSPYKILEELPQVSQVIVEDASPNSWEEVSQGYGNINFVVWYILKHHTSFLEMFDFYKLSDVTPPRKKSWGLNGGTIASQIEEVVESTLGFVGSSSNGSLYIVRNPSMENTTYRNDLDNAIEWTANDIIEDVSITRKFFNNTAYVRLYTLAMKSTNETEAYASIAPGLQQGQAGGSTQVDNVLLPPLSGQTECNFLSGQIFAKENNPIGEISLSLIRNMDVTDPAKGVWQTVNISEHYSPIGKQLYHRIFPVGVNRGWEKSEYGSWYKNIEISGEIETFGQPGITLPVNPGDGLIFPAVPPFEIPYGAISPSGTDSDTSAYMTGTALAIDDDGNLLITKNYSSSSPSWTNISSYVTGTPCDISWDYNAAYFSSGIKSDAIGFYVVSISGTNVYVYRFNNTKNLSDKELLVTYSMDDSTSTDNAVISTNSFRKNLVLVAFKDRTGIQYGRSIDNGDTWSSAAYVENAITDTEDNDNCSIGISTYNQTQIIGAYNDSDGGYVSYYTLTEDGSFTKIVDSPIVSTPNPAMCLSSIDNAYISVINTEPASGAFYDLIDFDFAPIHTTITNGTPYDGTVSIVAQGVFGSNCIRMSGTVTSSGSRSFYTMTFPTAINLYNVFFSENGTSHTFTMDFYLLGVLQTSHAGAASFSTPFVSKNFISNLVGWSPGVTCDEIRVRLSIATSIGNPYQVRHDNIIIQTVSGSGETYELYHVSGISSVSPNWTDITLPNSDTPRRTNDLIADKVDGTIIYASTIDDGNWYKSTNSGNTWTLKGSGSDHMTFDIYGPRVTSGGNGTLGVSVNFGEDFYNKLGNANTAANGLGLVKHILLV